MDHVGPMARTAADCALVLGAMAGYDPADPTTSVLPVPDFSVALGRDVKGLRIGSGLNTVRTAATTIDRTCSVPECDT